MRGRAVAALAASVMAFALLTACGEEGSSDCDSLGVTHVAGASLHKSKTRKSKPAVKPAAKPVKPATKPVVKPVVKPAKKKKKSHTSHHDDDWYGCDDD